MMARKLSDYVLKKYYEKNIIIAVVSVFCFACNDGKLDERKLDAAEEKLDAAGEKLKGQLKKAQMVPKPKVKRLDRYYPQRYIAIITNSSFTHNSIHSSSSLLINNIID